MKRNFLLLTLFLLFIVSCAAQENNPSAKSVSIGKIKGTIFDPGREAAILGTKVTIDGNGKHETLYPNPDSAEYEFNVPAGIYTITTEAGWWLPIKRASFRVESAKTTIINLYPAIRIGAIFLTLSGDKAEYAPLPKYDSFTFSDVASTVVIQYSKRRSILKANIYKNAVLTFDSQTILADTIRLDKQSKIFELEGNILIDADGQKTKIKRARIKIQGGKLMVI